MSFQANIQAQYYAALKMIWQAIDKCPDSLWDDRSYTNVYSQIVFHSLFYTHFYLYPGPEAFTPWPKHRQGTEQMKFEGEPYSKTDLLEYCELVRQEVSPKVNALDLESPSGFPWRPTNRMEMHIYNLRHLQQHIGEMCERLGVAYKIDIDWS